MLLVLRWKIKVTANSPEAGRETGTTTSVVHVMCAVRKGNHPMPCFPHRNVGVLVVLLLATWQTLRTWMAEA